MSFYVTLSGRIRYRTKEALDAALTFLRERGWLDDQNVFLDERGQRMWPRTTLRGMTLQLPRCVYRNLGGTALDRILAGSEHRIAWASTDGVEAAGVIVDGEETTFELDEWAAEHCQGEEYEGEDDLDLEDEFIDWAEWKYEFHTLAEGG
jgi:hypothetical protein